MYRVIKEFTDLQDDNYYYKENDIFPRKGKEVSKERIDELSTKNNKRGEILIEEITETKQQEVTTEVDEETAKSKKSNNKK